MEASALINDWPWPMFWPALASPGSVLASPGSSWVLLGPSGTPLGHSGTPLAILLSYLLDFTRFYSVFRPNRPRNTPPHMTIGGAEVRIVWA